MNKEIEEILDRLDYNEWEVDLYKIPINWCEMYSIRDYITNLQEENKRLKEQLDMLVKDDEKQQKIIIDLQQIINKAIEYIENYKDIQAKNVYVDFDLKDINKLLDILRGEDNE